MALALPRNTCLQWQWTYPYPTDILSFLSYQLVAWFCIRVLFHRYITWYSGTCLIRHTKGPGKCVRLYRMSEISGVCLHKFHCVYTWHNDINKKKN
jgi:hypothetical protein